MKDSRNSQKNPNKHQFVLFVSGMSQNSGHAVENMRKICDTFLADNFELQIIDISRDKQLAVEYQIIGIPTLIKLGPGARRTILGNLSDTEKVLKILDIIP